MDKIHKKAIARKEEEWADVSKDDCQVLKMFQTYCGGSHLASW